MCITIFLQYEKSRQKNPRFVSDVYDTQAWKARMRLLETYPADTYLLLLFCIDSINLFKNLGYALTPGEFVILNLPPRFRTKVEHIMLSLLVPSKLKAKSQQKYFDYLIKTELNPLVTTGIQHS